MKSQKAFIRIDLSLAFELHFAIQELSVSSPSTARTDLNKFVDETTTQAPADRWILAGIAIALTTIIAGIASTGVNLRYFLQPTAAWIVMGGTFGVTLITTPRKSLLHAVRRVFGLLRQTETNREALVEEIVSCVRTARVQGVLAVEPRMKQVSNAFLREMLALAIDVKSRSDFQTTLETKLRLRERQGDADAKVLEVAGGFAPAIGVIGTVVGLIDVLRQFSNMNSVAFGIGTAFVSTMYGLALANLILLPAAHRIRASVAETFEIEEMIVEGGICLIDGTHPSLVRERLNCFLRQEPRK
ncbi:MAG: MotA/TolQ/ExbB proton channel family protein [Acidobacteriota bacterium]